MPSIKGTPVNPKDPKMSKLYTALSNPEQSEALAHKKARSAKP